MHIVHVLTRFLRAGSEENTIATCRWQATAGHKVTVIHGRDFDPFWYAQNLGGITLISLETLVHPIRPLADLRAVMKLRHLYRALKPDVIHTHQSKAGILGRVAANATPAARVVHGVHILPFHGVGQMKRRIYIAAEKYAAHRTDVFITVSRHIADQYVNAGICRENRIACVYSGMELSTFKSAEIPQDWAEMLGLRGPKGHRPPVILMLAAFEPRKRHGPFLREFRRVVKDVPDVRLLLAGTGPCEQATRQMVDDLGLSEHVRFCGHRSDPEALLALADVTVLASEREGLPRVAVQSIAAGRPIVINDLPGIREIVTDGHNGYVVGADDMDALADKLILLLTDNDLRARLRAQARATDVSNWSLEALGAGTTGLYHAADR